VHGLSPAAQAALADETLAVLEHPDFAPLFAPGSAAEVPVVALLGGRALAGQIDRLVVGADQVLSLDGRLLHKSPDRATALATLVALAGRTHRLTSAFTLARAGAVVAEDAEVADLTVRPLSEATLARYLDLAGEGVLGSVGVYQWEGFGAHLFERVQGEHSTILGLPMLKLLGALRALGALTL